VVALGAGCRVTDADRSLHDRGDSASGDRLESIETIAAGRRAVWIRRALPFADTHGAALAFAADGAMLVVMGKGVARSEDLGRSWHVLAGSRSETSYSNDGGASFVSIERARKSWFLKPTADTSFETLAAVCAGGRLVVFGKGATSTRLSSFALAPGDDTVFHRVFCYDGPRRGCLAARDTEIYAGGVIGGQPVLYATTDGGKSWRPRWWGNVGDPKPIELTFLDARRGVLLLDEGTLLRTEDGGETWLAAGGVPLGAASDVLTMEWVDERVGFLAGRGGYFASTTDGGRSWRRWGLPTSADLASILPMSAADVWVVGSAGTVIHSKTGGMTWERVDLGIGEDLASVARFDGAVWIVGDGSVWIFPPGDGLPVTRGPGRAWPAPSPFAS
jgi:photosystem II stability/assembly factor-like uncharacterized protein